MENWKEPALVVVIGLLAFAHVLVQDYDVPALEAIILTFLVVAGAMLGAYYGSRKLIR